MRILRTLVALAALGLLSSCTIPVYISKEPLVTDADPQLEALDGVWQAKGSYMHITVKKPKPGAKPDAILIWIIENNGNPLRFAVTAAKIGEHRYLNLKLMDFLSDKNEGANPDEKKVEQLKSGYIFVSADIDKEGHLHWHFAEIDAVNEAIKSGGLKGKPIDIGEMKVEVTESSAILLEWIKRVGHEKAFGKGDVYKRVAPEK